MHDADADDDDVDLILEDDSDPGIDVAQRAADAHPWRILIVDDDVDVHVVTKFSLNNIEFQGRRLSYLHAYSAEEALSTLRLTPDIALILLDVVMETPDAGLQVVRQVREELRNGLVRIVLRTGRPGQQHEHALLLDYDINDFFTKADLTTRKLVTTVICALRAYDALATSFGERAALGTRLQQAESVRAGIDQHVPLLVLDRHGRVVEASAALCRLLRVDGAALRGRLASTLAALAHDAPPLGAITQALTAKETWSGTIRLQLADKEVPVQTVVQCLHGADGQVSGYLVIGSLCADIR